MVLPLFSWGGGLLTNRTNGSKKLVIRLNPKTHSRLGRQRLEPDLAANGSEGPVPALSTQNVLAAALVTNGPKPTLIPDIDHFNLEIMIAPNRKY